MGFTGLAEGLGDGGLPLLEEINLCDASISKEAAPTFGKFLTGCPRLSKITGTKGNPGLFSIDGFTGLAEGLGDLGLPLPEEINLCDANISKEAAEALGLFITRCPRLKKVSGLEHEHTDFLNMLVKGAGPSGLPEGLAVENLCVVAETTQPPSGQ